MMQTVSRVRLSVAVAVAAMCLAGAEVGRADLRWVGPADTLASWFETNDVGEYVNWQTGNLPTNEGAYLMGRGKVLVDEPGGKTLTLYICMDDSFLGPQDNSAELIITNGGVLTCNAVYMSNYAGSRTGILTMVGGTFTNTGMTIGAQRYGELNLMSGKIDCSGAVTFGSGSTGRGKINVSGGLLACDSLTFAANGYATGTISGGTIDVSTTCYIGLSSTGHLEHSGGTLEVGTLTIGRYAGGKGLYTLGGTGRVDVLGALSLADSTDSSCEWNVGGGSMTVAGDIRHLRGDCTINISSGSVTQTGGAIRLGDLDDSKPSRYIQSGGRFKANDYVFFADNARTTNTFHISGGELEIPSVLRLGHGTSSSSTGTISGGTIEMGSVMYLAYGLNSVGEIVHSGGLIRSLSTLVVGYNANVASAVYHLTGNGRLQMNTVNSTAGSGGQFIFDGGDFGVYNFAASMGVLTNAGGTVSPGLEGVAGCSQIQSDYTETTSSAGFHVDIGGTIQANAITNGPDYYDYCDVDGTATLMGELSVQLIHGFEDTVQSIDTFTILNATAVSGPFNNVADGDRITTVGGRSFRVDYTATQVQLTDFKPRPRGTITIVR